MDYRRTFSGYASRPDAELILFAVAFAEAMFIPLPSDFLLIPMAMLVPERGFRYAVIAALGSVGGALVGYGVGITLFQVVSGVLAQWAWVDGILTVLREYSGVFIVAAGFSSVPFNIVTFLSGFVGVNIALFLALTLAVRVIRYMVIGWLIWRAGTRYQEWLERNFYGTMLVMTLALLVVSAIGVLLFETA